MLQNTKTKRVKFSCYFVGINFVQIYNKRVIPICHNFEAIAQKITKTTDAKYGLRTRICDLFYNQTQTHIIVVLLENYFVNL